MGWAASAVAVEEKEQKMNTAIFAGGCFWGLEEAFQNEPGVQEAVSGYTGGSVKNPTYAQVSSGTTGHREAVKVIYDPEQIPYSRLLDIYWRQIDPTDTGGQSVDRGSQYTTAIFYLNEEQRNQAEQSKKKLDASGRFSRPVVTEVLPAAPFYPAEEYHQDYYRKKSCPYEK
ncbi:MAG: peptide-methionine (S)-S-oxide reductase MsrA [Candidatus Omnitrophica bacterium]|nr:peptide-methionine (S)-S-oxide reductase MsrA [Candidatus Omnitrophota bacterium]